MKNENLQEDTRDMLVSILKASTSLLPSLGPLLYEIIASVIPEQRLDRIADFIENLEKRLNLISQEVLTEFKNNDEFVALIEESIYQASRATTQARRQYIVSIVINGITNMESRYMLKLLHDLNDVEVIILLGCSPQKRYDRDFVQKHPNVSMYFKNYGLNHPRGSVSFEESINESYKKHLINLNLIYDNYFNDGKSPLPILDGGGNPKINHTETTSLGNRFLKHMDLV
jgi:hypothetical protein